MMQHFNDAISLTSPLAVSDGVVVRLKELVKIPLPPAAGLCDYGFLLFQLVPQTGVGPSVPQLVQHLIRSQEDTVNADVHWLLEK